MPIKKNENNNLDTLSTEEIIEKLYLSQKKGVSSLSKTIATIETIVKNCLPSLNAGGRLVFVGAGTSGRCGAMEAAELWPTFSWPREKTLTLMAGGKEAFFNSMEGAEDDINQAQLDANSACFSPQDIVIALAASGETPYTTAIARIAREQKAQTIGISCKPNSTLLKLCQYNIYIPIKDEAVQGSTRLASGTAQKVILNILTTTFMIRLHRVYNSYMVNLKVTNNKLYKRAVEMVCHISSVEKKIAEQALFESNNEVKLACALLKFGNIDKARFELEKFNGNLRACLEQKNK